ncbi:MAG: EI24 domain-containing protein [Gammaproteobacteria bacterium]|nr:EI24 domain-containing protein [Gammaproteobacteria bacterium]MBU1623594.1 EI24 domain-containing protein [Gammaproteobacteria bacterium]
MNSVISALLVALKTFFHPRMLALVLWPMLLATMLWVGAAFIFWGSWMASLTGLVQQTGLEQWIAQGFLAIAPHYFIATVLVLLLLPAIYVTALMITAIFSMPAMVDHVAAKNYPNLERKQGGTTAGNVSNAVLAVSVYCLGWIISLPLWLFTPFALVLPIVLMAYLNQRLFRYDALAEHASRDEIDQVVERASGKLYLLGALAGLLQFVPLLNFIAPVYVALAFIHLCLDELNELRLQAA